MTNVSIASVLGLTLLSVAAWTAYFRWKDRLRPEPWPLLGAALGGGLAAALLALGGFVLSETLGLAFDWSRIASADWPEAFAWSLGIGAIEETAKWLPVLALALWSAHFDEPLDGVVYAACSGVGFAAGEVLLQLWLVPGAGWLPVFARAIASPLSHALFATGAGLGLGLARLSKQTWALPAGLGFSWLAHALYDLLLARPGLPTAAAAAVVLALWLLLIALTPRLARLHPAGAVSPVPRATSAAPRSRGG